MDSKCFSGSGVFDKNGKEIFANQTVKITTVLTNAPPLVRTCHVKFVRGAFRYFAENGDECYPIGDLSYRCETEIIG